VADIPPRIPKLRRGSYFPTFPQPRRRAGKALVAVIQTARVEGVSTRKVDQLIQALGLEGIDKRIASRICQRLDETVQRLCDRPLDISVVGCPVPEGAVEALHRQHGAAHRRRGQGDGSAGDPGGGGGPQ
jgi:hypothetical protein